MKTSQAGLDFIAQWSEDYQDEGGLERLAEDLEYVERCVSYYVKFWLSQPRFDALVSFAFGIGPDAFAGSNLLKELNGGGSDETVQKEIRGWDRVDGRVMRHLADRRAAEAEMWMS
jgi:lysozyme